MSDTSPPAPVRQPPRRQRARSLANESSARRLRDRALVLPLLGTALLLPPVASVFDLDAQVFGVPVTVAYLFGIWALLIIGAAALARPLADAADEDVSAAD